MPVNSAFNVVGFRRMQVARRERIHAHSTESGVQAKVAA